LVGERWRWLESAQHPGLAFKATLIPARYRQDTGRISTKFRQFKANIELSATPPETRSTHMSAVGYSALYPIYLKGQRLAPALTQVKRG
jgi:hypothetical protein